MRNKPISKKLSDQQKAANSEDAAGRWARYYKDRPGQDDKPLNGIPGIPVRNPGRMSQKRSVMLSAMRSDRLSRKSWLTGLTAAQREWRNRGDKADSQESQRRVARGYR